MLGLKPDKTDRWVLPKYPSSKDAMHEALKIIYDKPGNNAMVVKDESDLCNTVDWPLHATAFEEARSFLKVFGKWTEE